MTTHQRGATLTWALLLGLTLLSYGSWATPTWADPKVSGSAVIVIAGAKAWLIAERFMELRAAVWPLRLVFSLWVVLVTGLLVAMFWQA